MSGTGYSSFLLEISLEMLIKRIPINIVLLCLEDVIGFLFIEFQEGELHENHCFKGVHTESYVRLRKVLKETWVSFTGFPLLGFLYLEN